MRSISILLALVATSYAWSDSSYLEIRKEHKANGTAHGMHKDHHKGNGTMHKMGNMVDHKCHKMAALTRLTDLANNQTKLDALVTKGKVTQTEIDKLKAKAANATMELKMMESNTTLVQQCTVVDAHDKVVRQCKEMKYLTKLSMIANNQTALAAIMAKEKNGTHAAKLQERIGNATAKLQKMKTNTTLTDLCAKQEQKGGDAGTSSTGSSGGKTGAAASLNLQILPLILGLAVVFATL